VQLGEALLAEGRAAEAATQMRAAIALKPDYVELLNNLAWLLISRPDVPALDPGEPMRLVSRAIELSNGRNPYPLYTLAMLHARDGRFAEAVENASRAATLARAMGNMRLAEELDQRVASFRAGRKP
jgi:Flp pilus assembly protein TadD